MIKAFTFVLFCCLCNVGLWCQIDEDFSDGSLTFNPTWHGDTADFTINHEHVLQLKTDNAGNALIYTSLGWQQNRTWSIDFNLAFDPSASNQLQIYLFLNTKDLTDANGYFIELGESGSDDRIKFYSLQQGTPTLLGTGTTPFPSNPNIRLQASYQEKQWSISTIDLGTQVKNEEMVIDHSPDLSGEGFFGLHCLYTSTRTDKFFFDNIFIYPSNVEDISPPRLLDLEISAPTQLILLFSEALELSRAENEDNYMIKPGSITPASASLLADPTMVQLDLAESLTNGTNYHLVGDNIADTNGNIGSFEKEFMYVVQEKLDAFDIIINEIFDDPSPAIGLPAAEYIELLVRKREINLGQVVLKVGKREITLPNQIFRAGDLIVLHDADEKEKFSTVSGSISVEGWATLVNSGSDLQLADEFGSVIHTVSYHDHWYRHSTKSQGGWSLELINPGDPCALSENWQASENLTGGTPGYENSIFDPDANEIRPQVVNVLPIDTSSIFLKLNKSHLAVVESTQFSISGSIEIIDASVFGANLDQIVLTIHPSFDRLEEYQLSFSSLEDCSSNPFSTEPISIVLPSVLSPGDLKISEILFDPKPGGSDFVEIYNASAKSFRLSDLIIANQQNGDVKNLNQPFLLRPGVYLVLSENRNQLRTQYHVEHPYWVIETPLPNFNNDQGNVTLLTSSGGQVSIIDAFDYVDDMHSKLLKEKEGVSLERIDLSTRAQDASNWHSAAQSVGFATPTGTNSQVRIPQGGSWLVEPQVFSPDGDGFDDYTLINYKGIQSGTFVHIKVYDAAGRLVRYLANNESLANEGFIQWDGTTDWGTKAPIGIYSLHIQQFDLNGMLDQFKTSCVLAGRLD